MKNLNSLINLKNKISDDLIDSTNDEVIEDNLELFDINNLENERNEFISARRLKSNLNIKI